MNSFVSKIKITVPTIDDKGLDQPEAILRAEISRQYKQILDPYSVQFFKNYRVIEQYNDCFPTQKFIEVLTRIENRIIGFALHGEVIFGSRPFGTDNKYMDCDLLNLKKAIDEYIKSNRLEYHDSRPDERSIQFTPGSRQIEAET